MKTNIKLAIMAVAVAGIAATSAKAAIEDFKWQGAAVFGGDSTYVSGTLQYNTTTKAVTDFVFDAADPNGDPYSTPDNSYTGTPSFSGADLLLGTATVPGSSTGGSEGGTTTWSDFTYNSHAYSEATYNDGSGTLSVYGNWVQYSAVPEPVTYGAFAGMGLLFVSLRRQFTRKAA
jgi:hypothetical protein